MPPLIKTLFLTVFYISGAITFLGALLQWRWFINSRKYVNFCKLVGPFPARFVHILMGLAIIIFAFLVQLGVIPMR
jgi:hypothetical protein